MHEAIGCMKSADRGGNDAADGSVERVGGHRRVSDNRRRVVDDELDELMLDVAAIAIEGPRKWRSK